jgi:hypothetical protein
LLLAIGFSAGVQAQQGMRTILMSIARMYLWRFLPGGKHVRFYSINAMRARHPTWFHEDLERLFGLLQLTRSGHASPNGFPSTRSWMHIDALRRAASRASSSCARTFHRNVIGRRFSTSWASLPAGPRGRELSRRQPTWSINE